ncbi:MAG: hypothetical protein L6265_09880, partial [Thermoplasmatales archaeon]|nr:hypothetical protein [Thermoplasmatales archaeon]
MGKNWVMAALIFLVLMLLPYSAAASEPSVVCTDTNTETTTGYTFTKNYFVYYDENVSQGRIYVETYILFKNMNPNTTTFFQVKSSDVFHSGSHLNQTGWYTR